MQPASPLLYSYRSYLISTPHRTLLTWAISNLFISRGDYVISRSYHQIRVVDRDNARICKDRPTVRWVNLQ